MDIEVINNIKSLGIDMIEQAGSGHPGIVLGAAPIIYTLFAKHINVSTSDDKWLNRDRFVLSAGHGSALLYATLYMAGYNLEIDDLKQFRRAGSRTPGHPEYKVTPGVDMSTGPLGQGIASAVGMALADKILKQKLQIPRKSSLEIKRSLIDHNIYVLCGDGDLMEGISYEAASLAGTLGLDNLIVLYDSNNVSLDGNTSMTFKENVLERFQAMGWDTQLVKNGEDISSIDKAISKAKKSNKPTLIEVRTIIGKGSFLEGTNQVHGKVLTKEDVEQLKLNLKITGSPFYVNENARNYFRKQITERGNIKYTEWATNFKMFTEGKIVSEPNNYNYLFGKDEPLDLLNHDFLLEQDVKEATRVTNQKIMKEIAKYVPNFLGGSADLSSATFTYLNEFKDITPNDYDGRNIWFGVREHSMGAILNGLALYGFRTFGSTFLSFSDYVKPAIRMSAIMNLPVTYIFSHDSVYVGQDGPTHQPIEQLGMLRATPNLDVYRPCDGHEIIGCWNTILNTKKPSVLILSRNEVSLLAETKASEVSMGAYIIRKEVESLSGIIIATGTEVSTATYLARNLYENYKIDLRIVSMPNRELFLRQDKEYQEEILPMGYKKAVIEAGTSLGWERFVYNDKYLFTINEFGISGTKDEVLKHLGFDYETIEQKMIKLFK